MSYVSLHTHTEYSLLDGYTRIPGMVRRVKELGQNSIAITDHGSLSGAFKLWKECREYGIKPIIGCEFYFAPASRRNLSAVFWGEDEQRNCDVSGQGSYLHITVLAKSAVGLRNLFRLQREAYVTGFYRKPRIDFEILGQHLEGLVILSGCMGGPLSTRLRLGQVNEAEELAARFATEFPGSFFVEIMDHGQEEDVALNAQLVPLAQRLGIPLVFTNDSHYTLEEDSGTHDALLCLQTQAKQSDAKRFRFNGEGYFLLSNEQALAVATRASLPLVSVSQTQEIADSVEPYDEVFDRRLSMPMYYNREISVEEELRSSCHLLAVDLSDEYHNRLNEELEVICSMGYADYFLIIADIINWGRSQGIRFGPGRGSAGGSLVSYLLGITEIDPLEHELLFERFLNKDRVSLPDIDIDVIDTRRDEVLRYIQQQYGEEFVAQLGTFGTIGARAALHDSARVLGYTRTVSQGLVARLPRAVFERQPKLAEMAPTNDHKDIQQLAARIEGTVRNEGIHAAGIIISNEPLSSRLPVRRPRGADSVVTCFDMGEVEDLGLVKIDILGLRNLGVIDDCLQLLDEEITLPTSPGALGDRETYRLLSEGHTLGVFQLDSQGMQRLLRKVQPSTFNDIPAVLALYRPGPMGVDAHTEYANRKNRKSSVVYPHEEFATKLSTVLSSTYGLIIYQEQVMHVLKEIAGYSYAEADLIFNAMRKKDRDKMEAARPDFVERAMAFGYSKTAVDSLWQTLVPFADYSFNKAHSTGYGLVAYWTAFLKANYPVPYMAALLSSVSEDKTRLPAYLDEAQRMNIPLLPPDINLSGSNFTPTNNGITFGLSAIAGVGAKATEAIIKNRPYESLDHFFKTADKKALNAGVLGALIRAGALNSLCDHTEELFGTYVDITERALAYRDARRKGQPMLVVPSFNISGQHPVDWNMRKKWQLETLGIDLTNEPIELKLLRPLSEMEWSYIYESASRNRGGQRVYATLPSGLRFYTGVSVRMSKEIDAVFHVLPVELSIPF